jgi:hypothetical protein
MTTRSLTGQREPSQHWTDDFDLPPDELSELVARIFERFVS